MNKQLILGNNIEKLKELADNSIDSVVTDAPYGLGKEQDMNIILKDWLEKGYSEIKGKGFMGKEWDAYVPQPAFWKEVIRVMKPGAHALSFFGSRTYDIGVMAMRLGGFEIRDTITYHYGSGFPKSLNVGKKIDEIQGTSEYEGWGTGLKPASEYIVMARKPLSEKTVAENVLKWGTGGINIDGCRVGVDGGSKKVDTNKCLDSNGIYGNGINGGKPVKINEGRFPANLIFECICDEVIKGEKGEPRISDKKGGSPIFGSELSVNYQGKWHNDKGDIHTNPDCPCRILDEQSGNSKSSNNGGLVYRRTESQSINKKGMNKLNTSVERKGFTDKGGASRFFYTAKASKSERNKGLTTLTNNHPTIKPIKLMEYLCKLVTPPNGTILDTFMGSGTTGIAALGLGFNFIGMEMDEGYYEIAKERLNNIYK
jgi:site-specific DNA-methyltransferase (adenine-specific)